MKINFSSTTKPFIANIVELADIPGRVRDFPINGVPCAACEKRPAVEWIGNLAGYYIAMCGKCRKQYLCAPSRKAMKKGFTQRAIQVIDNADKEFDAGMAREMKKVKALKRRYGKNWTKAVEAML